MIGIAHFHCSACEPVLVLGRTRAVCGAVIPQQIVGWGINRRCGDCKRALRTHKDRTGHQTH